MENETKTQYHQQPTINNDPRLMKGKIVLMNGKEQCNGNGEGSRFDDMKMTNNKIIIINEHGLQIKIKPMH